MKLTTTTHLWFTKLRKALDSWLDFRVDLAGLSFREQTILSVY